jgi:hypothetical protein
MKTFSGALLVGFLVDAGCSSTVVTPPSGNVTRSPDSDAIRAAAVSTNYRVVRSFAALPDGQFPCGALVTDNGGLFGSTTGGGRAKSGTIFSLAS